MPAIAVKPRVFKNYLLKIGADSYEAHVSSVALTPSSSIQTWKGGTPAAVFTDATTPTWVADLAYAQDWETPNSLSIYLLNNEGATKEVEFSPLGSGPKFTVTVIITPGAIGGAIDEFGTATVSLGVQGKPVYTAGAVTP
ncbi:hypothetical protein [Glaciibacter psychrotolerans]|uniref:Uncharacterized protein n=1 Tax=Glaciibacter psychrotolerans TaxID=670054 RepID=A0A7Z0EFN6_9MICO|nr:hypothetical protein [Leifsonia psychrotolerans]NYJ20808.1 hypothetical protein [Leifsonia psychrotolerans]